MLCWHEFGSCPSVCRREARGAAFAIRLDGRLRPNPHPLRHTAHVRCPTTPQSVTAAMKRFLYLCLVSLMLGPLLYRGSVQAQPPSEVLLLNSYHQGLQWTDNIVEGVKAFFSEKRRRVILQIEYLDTKRIDDPAYFELVYHLFQKKFAQRTFDAVIASDDHAFSFLRAHADDLFGDVPVVFCGVNFFAPAMLAEHPNFTGVIEAFDVRATLSLMARLHDTLDTVVVVNDRTKTGQANRKIIDAALADFGDTIGFRFLSDVTMAELKEKLRALPGTTAVLLMSFTRDRNGQVFSYDESIEQIAASCPVPIYGVWDFYLDKGIVGGLLTSGYHQGYTAAGLADRILEGQPAADIDVVKASPNHWMFDDDQLRRFDIARDALPPDALVINRPESFYGRHRSLIWSGGSVIAALILIIGLLVFNIERRKAVETALSTSESILKATLESTTDGVLVVDPDGSVSHYNTRFREIWSLPQHLLDSRDDARMLAFVKDQLVDPDHFVSQVNHLYRSMHQSWDVLAFKDGRIIERFFAPLNAGGIHGGLVWFFRDVTESRRKDDALREGARQLKLAQAMAHVGNWELAIESGQVRGSEEAARIFGLAAQAQPFDLKAVLRLVDRRDRPRVIRAMQRLQSRRDNINLEFRIRPPVGSATCWVHLRARLVTDNTGRPTRAVGTLQDVTARIEAEESRQALERQLVHAIKMEAVGTLAGGIAHDFNNLLQAISGYTQLLLLDQSSRGLDTRPLEKIEAAAERARELARQLLTFSRKVESDLQPLPLNPIVDEAFHILARTIPKMVTIEKHLAMDLMPVEVDANQIEQVVLNIGINASHAMPDGGRLAVSTAMAPTGEDDGRPAEAPAGPYVMLKISDTGAGMDKATLERIFDPFFTTKGVGAGTGLGLSMVYGIIKNHGGWITCDSAPGQGTTFNIYLPGIREAAAPSPRRIAHQDLPCGSETVLLVDDEVDLCELGSSILERYGYRVETAGSGEEALEIYQRAAAGIDLVILDVNMPGMGGYKCLQALRQIDPQVKIVVASGYSPHLCEQDLLALGAYAFIAKPFELETLLAVVRTAIDQAA